MDIADDVALQREGDDLGSVAVAEAVSVAYAAGFWLPVFHADQNDTAGYGLATVVR